MAQEYILEMNHIVKAFSGVRALDDVDFKVRRGEIMAICGENGAGKSTLMNVARPPPPRFHILLAALRGNQPANWSAV